MLLLFFLLYRALKENLSGKITATFTLIEIIS